MIRAILTITYSIVWQEQVFSYIILNSNTLPASRISKEYPVFEDQLDNRFGHKNALSFDGALNTLLL